LRLLIVRRPSGEDKFLPFAVDQFHRSGLDASKICFEITEMPAVASFSQANRFIQELKELAGVQVCAG